MDVNSIIQVVTTLGFPIVMCGAMAWYVKYITDKQREEIKELNAQHNEEIQKTTEALNNNTLALQTLCDKINFKVIGEETK